VLGDEIAHDRICVALTQAAVVRTRSSAISEAFQTDVISLSGFSPSANRFNCNLPSWPGMASSKSTGTVIVDCNLWSSIFDTTLRKVLSSWVFLPDDSTTSLAAWAVRFAWLMASSAQSSAVLRDTVARVPFFSMTSMALILCSRSAS